MESAPKKRELPEKWPPPGWLSALVRERYHWQLFTLSIFLISDPTLAATYIYDDTVTYSWETATTDVVWDEIRTYYPRDDDKDEVNIGFTFNFGSVDYTQVKILSNGALHFGANQGFHKYYNNEALPITSYINGPGPESAANRVISPYWDDINPRSGGTVRYSTLGAAPDRRFVASWENIPAYPSTNTYIFQVILYETGDIKFQYGPGYADGASATIGVEIDDSDYTQYSYNTGGAVGNGKAILFYRPSPHFAIDHDGEATTSIAEPVTITSHNSNHSINQSYIDTITLSTSTSHGEWSLITGSGALINSGSGSATYTFVAGDNGKVELGLSSAIDETLNIYVTDGTYSENAGEDPDLTFSGLIYKSFRDNFSVSALNNSDGSLDWTGNSWIEIDPQGAGATGGNALITGGELLLDDRPNNTNPSMAREVDLTPYTTATLSFDFRTTNGIENGDSIVVEASPDGGSAWIELENISGINGATAGSRSYPLESYPSLFPFTANTRIRFRVNVNYRGTDEQFLVDYLEIRVGASAFHYSLSHNGFGIYCLPEEITIEKRDATDTAIDASGSTITIDTQSGKGDWSITTGTGIMNNGTSNDGIASYTYATGEKSVVLSLSYQEGTSPINISVSDGSATDDDTEGMLPFYPNGILITDTEITASSAIDTTIASKIAGTEYELHLTAYGQTAADPTCRIIDGYTDTAAKSLRLWGSYSDPVYKTSSTDTNPLAPVALNVNSRDIDKYEDESTNNHAITFTNGKATINYKYKDVGLVGLKLKDISSGIRSNSDYFVVKPADLVLSNITNPVDAGTINCANVEITNPVPNDASGDIFTKAGETFCIDITAKDSDGDATPSFGKESTPETVLLASPGWSASKAYALGDIVMPTTLNGHSYMVTTAGTSSATEPTWPTDGSTVNDNGVIWQDYTGYLPDLIGPVSGSSPALNTVSAPSFSSGAATGQYSWPEVGIIQLTPHIGDGNYLGAGDVIGTISDNIGRFYPSYFTTTTSNGSFANKCIPGAGATNFTYLGEYFTYDTKPTIITTAKNIGGSTTTNYTGDFAKLETTELTLFYPLEDNTKVDGGGANKIKVTPANTSLGRTDNADGTLTFTLGGGLTSDIFTYTRSGNMIKSFDSDLTIKLTAFADIDGVSANDLSSPKEIKPTGNRNRYGKGYAIDSYSSSSTIGSTLTVSIGTQYLDATGSWSSNSDDICSQYSYTNADSGITTTSAPPSLITLSGGVGDLTLTLTGDTSPTGGKATINTTFDSWLQNDLGNSPSATATYGNFRGDDRFLFRYEVER